MGVCGKIAGTLLSATLLCLFAGCGDETESDPPDAGSQAVEPVVVERTIPETRVIVTSHNASLEEGCRPRPVAETVIRFVDAFNYGDQAMLSQVFFVSEGPSPADFSSAGYYPWSWYSVNEVGQSGKIEDGFVTYDQTELLRYFARRHQQGERLRLFKGALTGTGLLDEESNVGFVFVLARHAKDLGPDVGGPARIAYGKGALNCRNGRIFTWSMDMKIGEKRTEREAAAWLCKDPLGWRPGRTVVACT